MSQPPVRVLLVDLHTRFLGAQRVLVDVLAESPVGLSPVLLCAGEPRIVAEAERLGVECISLPMPERLSAVTRRRPPGPFATASGALYARAFRRAVRSARPDVVVANTPKAHVMCAIAAPTGVPLGARLHDIMPASAHIRLLTRGLLARRTASVSCVSDVVSRSAVALGYAPERVVTFFNGAPSTPAARAARNGPVRVIATVGQLEPWKGQDLAVEALGRLRESHPALRLRVIGRPVKRATYSRYLHARADALGIADRVEFVEHLTNVTDIYRGVDALVHVPRRPDPLPTVIIEALASGVPVIASRTGGIPEMIDDGETGLIVPVGDTGALADAIASLTSEDGLATRLAERGAVSARERFDRARYADAMSAWIADLAAGRKTWLGAAA